MNREPIMVALFAKVAALPGVVTTSRILRHYTELRPADQPAVFLSPQSQSAERRRGFPTKWTMNVLVYVYVKRQGADVVPDTAMNAILDAVEAALAPAPGVEVQTLGGLVEHCWIEGEIQTDEGVLGDQAISIIPLRLLITT